MDSRAREKGQFSVVFLHHSLLNSLRCRVGYVRPVYYELIHYDTLQMVHSFDLSDRREGGVRGLTCFAAPSHVHYLITRSSL